MKSTFSFFASAARTGCDAKKNVAIDRSTRHLFMVRILSRTKFATRVAFEPRALGGILIIVLAMAANATTVYDAAKP